MRILFELSNCDTHLHAYAPIVDALRASRKGIRCDVLSLCEFFRNTTHLETLSAVFDSVYSFKGTVAENSPQPVFSANPFKWKKTASPLAVLAIRRRLKEILAQIQPSTIVVSNDRFFPSFDVILLANRLRIPTLLVQESVRKDAAFERPKQGLPRQVIYRLLRFELGSLCHGQGGCTRIAAWGDHGRDYFVSVGVESDKICVTGSPRIDYFVERAKKCDKDTCRGLLGLRPKGRVVLMATNPLKGMGIASLDEYLEALWTILGAAHRAGASGADCRLLLKPHSLEVNDHRQYGLELACEMSPYLQFLADIPLESAIAASDAVLVFNSTVVLEATLMKKPVGMVNLHNWNLGVDFSERGLATLLTTPSDVVGFITGRELAETGGALATDYYVRDIGSAAERIADEILSLAGM